ncbi:MAG: ribbon-helix-helix protein, CopG family [Acidobacteriia bacterium]|nr:ribbon-helix-helix protein, CopG family [Terriglobia bacterium]
MPMEVIRIVIDAELLREIDQAARRAGISRSAFISDALREYLKRLRPRRPTERDRKF